MGGLLLQILSLGRGTNSNIYGINFGFRHGGAGLSHHTAYQYWLSLVELKISMGRRNTLNWHKVVVG